MKHKIPIEQLLRWRLTQAENAAPPAPRAARLLEQARPWWETWPERFQSLVQRLGHIQIAYGHAMTEPSQGRSGGYPVATLIVLGSQELEASIRVLYLNVRNGRLSFRFQLNAAIQPIADNFDTTFIFEDDKSPLLSAQATRSVDREYRIDMDLSEELAKKWEGLKVMDRMPFRLILRSNSSTHPG